MSLWKLAEYAAWLLSIAFVGWMLWDSRSVGRQYSEDVLLSSREGEE
jgi:hypothetical protein